LNKLPIPTGYRIEQLKRSEIPEVIRCFRDWFPDVTVGAEIFHTRLIVECDCFVQQLAGV
jgi:hypothetical protein